MKDTIKCHKTSLFNFSLFASLLQLHLNEFRVGKNDNTSLLHGCYTCLNDRNREKGHPLKNQFFVGKSLCVRILYRNWGRDAIYLYHIYIAACYAGVVCYFCSWRVYIEFFYSIILFFSLKTSFCARLCLWPLSLFTVRARRGHFFTSVTSRIF